MTGIREMSPKSKARLSGLFFLLTIVTGIVAQGFISGRLIVSGDATATATNILANESLYRLGFAVYLIEMACQITMTVLLYELLKPVNRSVALLAAIFSYVGCGIKTLSRLFFFAPLLVLGGADYLTVFTAAQLQALALLFLKINDQAAAIGLIFFGLHTVLKGYLIMRSTFLPRVLGAVTVVAGLGWLAYLSPPFASRVFPIIVGLGLLGALANILWLLIRGVDEGRWKEQAGASAASIWR